MSGSKPSRQPGRRPTSLPGAIGRTNVLSIGIATRLVIWSSVSSIDSNSFVVSRPDMTNLPIDSMPFFISLVLMSGYCEHTLAYSTPMTVQTTVTIARNRGNATSDFRLLVRASCKTHPDKLLRRTIRSRGAIFFAREVSLAERLTVWHGLPHAGRAPSCIPRMHSGRRGNAGGHRRNRINWSADSARMPNIR